jgi:hypothetical protein
MQDPERVPALLVRFLKQVLFGSVMPGLLLILLVENTNGSGLGAAGALRIALTAGFLFAFLGLGSSRLEAFAERSPVQASVLHMVLIATLFLGFPLLAGVDHLFPTSQEKARWTYVGFIALGLLAGLIAKRYSRRSLPPSD